MSDSFAEFGWAERSATLPRFAIGSGGNSRLTQADIEAFARFGVDEGWLIASQIQRVSDSEARELYGIRFTPKERPANYVSEALNLRRQGKSILFTTRVETENRAELPSGRICLTASSFSGRPQLPRRRRVAR
jgi:hypothetical protein